MASVSNKEPKVGSGDEAASSAAGLPGVAAAPPQGAEPGDDEAAAAVLAAAPTRPYYECVFCKRGFTTAQALGGHMNIHRRDRAKPSVRDVPSGTTTSMSPNVECYNQYCSHQLPYPAVPPARATPMSTSRSFMLAYHQHQGTGASTGVAHADASVNPSSASPRELSLFGAAARDRDLHGRGGDGSGVAPEGSDRQAADGSENRITTEAKALGISEFKFSNTQHGIFSGYTWQRPHGILTCVPMAI
ncbi:uncharacterized protein LOC119330261 [Triticum dicoccoides]|uniref:uncharacterized protein LOC119330261 n=1 Tax=Triticum dicoccoides TaxID=85692 RepID=UPI00188E897D|nr:uncharacterized protein LOC119330261 [Triticum dicoccoides]